MWTNIADMDRLRAAFAACVLAIAVEAGAATCTVSATGPNFGTYDLFSSAPLDAAGSINFQCNEPSAMLVFISTGGSGSYSARAMRSGAATLQYNLYIDAGRVVVWGDLTGGSGARFLASSRGQTIPIFGRIPPLQDAASGVYADTLVATFNF
jgi:spore coat protein U-like protein